MALVAASVAVGESCLPPDLSTACTADGQCGSTATPPPGSVTAACSSCCKVPSRAAFRLSSRASDRLQAGAVCKCLKTLGAAGGRAAAWMPASQFAYKQRWLPSPPPAQHNARLLPDGRLRYKVGQVPQKGGAAQQADPGKAQLHAAAAQPPRQLSRGGQPRQPSLKQGSAGSSSGSVRGLGWPGGAARFSKARHRRLHHQRTMEQSSGYGQGTGSTAGSEAIQTMRCCCGAGRPGLASGMAKSDAASSSASASATGWWPPPTNSRSLSRRRNRSTLNHPKPDSTAARL